MSDNDAILERMRGVPGKTASQLEAMMDPTNPNRYEGNDNEPRVDLTEARVRARLAWNGWPDTPESRKIIADHEARDPISARAWDRVIESLRS